MAEREFLSAGRAAEQSARAGARRTKALLGALAVMMLIGWWQQDWLKAQYQWRVVMQPAILTPEQERTLAPKSEFRECAHGCPTMVVVPAGSFTMGSPESEKARDDERPQHEVTLAKPFAIGKFHITFAEWGACVEAGACRQVGWGGDRPVIDVSWEDAKLYASWLSRVTGKEYRLLTEAEWEYAARAGSKTRYFFGDDEAELGQYAWYKGNSGGKAHPVGKKKANAFGLYDMHGNVWQWVEDCYHESYEGAPSDSSAWATGDCRRRVLRGGASVNAPEALWAATRFGFEPVFRGDDIGFRLGRTMTP
jgi:formylglycine-generating enzyme required for sulfatase activity